MSWDKKTIKIFGHFARLVYGDSLMTHAMVFTGCHEPEEGGGGVVRCACAVACGYLICKTIYRLYNHGEGPY